jgi:transcriptional regulator with GAF, ATPase, and Fis domain
MGHMQQWECFLLPVCKPLLGALLVDPSETSATQTSFETCSMTATHQTIKRQLLAAAMNDKAWIDAQAAKILSSSQGLH